MSKLKYRGEIHAEHDLWVYWIRIDISSDNEPKETSVLAGISGEKLNERSKLKNGEDLTNEQKNDWIESIIKKWLDMGDEIFETKIHYDPNDNQVILKFLKSLLIK